LLNAGSQLLQNATARFVYDLHAYTNTGKPAVMASILRETHNRNEQGQLNPQPRLQLAFEFFSGAGAVIMKKAQAEPGTAKSVQIIPNDVIVVNEVNTSPLLRWIGNGKVIVNNKGNVVKQYEPYFSITNQYEDYKELVETGVTPIMYYDAVGRLVRTDMPDGSFSKLEFDNWMQLSWDANDTVAGSEWFKRRTDVTRPDFITDAKEQQAAAKASLHANTPGQLHLDTQGRVVLFVEHNKNITTLANELYNTHIVLDIEGNTRSVVDARGNLVMEHKYNMLGNKVYQNNMDAGQRWQLANILEKPLRTWDERNHEFSFEYDVLHRPVQSKVTGGDGDTPLDHIFDRILYGESQPNPELINLRGQIFRQYDTAGLVEITDGYDFKGKPVSTKRKLFSKYKEVCNWTNANLLTDLEPEAFVFTNSYDALGRITRQGAPDGSIITPSYNEAGLLESETVQHVNPAETITYIKNIDYNEKGQRSKIVYGNDVSTNFYYDTNTFRLKRLESKKKNNDPLQDWYYTFDASGNITHIEDRNIPVHFFDNNKVTGTLEYTYDAIYRLVEATGRENDSPLNFGDCDNWNDKSFIHFLNAGDPVSLRTYRQKYSYDTVGNIHEMRHIADGGNWTRTYDYEALNNRLQGTHIGDNGAPEDYTTYPHHASHGFLTALPHLETIAWNFKEEVVLTSRQHCTADNIPVITYYQYDGQGNRIRKITENPASAGGQPTKKEERIYLAGYEIYKKHSGANAGLERISLSLMDQEYRFVMTDTRNHVDDGTDTRVVRYQLHNHLGSASLELDNDAEVISYEEYHPYGTTAYQANNNAIQSAFKRYRYTGMERDEETGLEYHNARYYVPWLGRWLNCDPIGIEDGVNVYAYCLNNPVKSNDTRGTQTADQTRFRAIFNERAAADRGTAHASTLVQAFRDGGISGSSARDRLVSVLTLAGGNPNAPSRNFDAYTIRAIGTDTGGSGDSGFRRELRDSVHYRRDARGGDIDMHRLSSDQVGHFLTAANFGFSLRERDNYIQQQQRAEAAFRRDHPYLSVVRDMMSPTTDMQVQYMFERTQFMNAMIGHEMVADRSILGSAATPTLRSFFMPSPADIQNFLNGRLDLIAINDSQNGNSYQDLLLTWIGYRFGENMANGVYSSREEAARWMEMMLTDQDLSAVARTDPFYADAQQVQTLLQQFRQIQQHTHPN
jgi:RHS repeat-associated protein